MKTQLLILLMIVMLFFVQDLVSAQKIYLSPGGDDNNPGTIEKPLATLTAARNRAREYRKNNQVNQPIEIIALEGEYFMNEPLVLTSEDAASSSAPLVFRTENGTKAVFYGGVKIVGFEKVNDKLWRAFIAGVVNYGRYFEQLYANNERLCRARTPNEGFFFIKKVTQTIIDSAKLDQFLGGTTKGLAVQRIEIDTSVTKYLNSFSKQDFDDVLITFYHNWDNIRKHITGYNREKSMIFTTGVPMIGWNMFRNDTHYKVENFKAALDAPGEWFLERSGYLYYMPHEGETLQNSTFYAPQLKEFIKIQGDVAIGKSVGNIRFENLVFQVAGYQTPPDGNEPAQAAAPVNAAITLDFANNIEFQNCEIAHTGTNAIWFRRACSNCLVSRCYMHDLGAGGIKIGETIIRPDKNETTNNITIDNNIIRDGGHVFPCATGILIFNARDNKVTHNEVADFRYSGISVGWVWGYAFSPSKRNKIEFNSVHHIGWGELCDLGGIYTLGASEGTTVSNNIVHHVYPFSYGGYGIYLDEGSSGITVENNLVYACKSSGFDLHYGNENTVRNNIFALNLSDQLQANDAEDHKSFTFTNNIIYFDKGNLLSGNWHKFNLLSDYNCYWDTRTKDIPFADKSFSDWQKSEKDVPSIIADPLFVNPAEFDFHFRNLSVAKKVKFVPFNFSQAGVYGSEEWKNLASFDQKVVEEFDTRVRQMETVSKK
jgi:parallel beta-helix repeat protein